MSMATKRITGIGFAITKRASGSLTFWVNAPSKPKTQRQNNQMGSVQTQRPVFFLVLISLLVVKNYVFTRQEIEDRNLRVRTEPVFRPGRQASQRTQHTTLISTVSQVENELSLLSLNKKTLDGKIDEASQGTPEPDEPTNTRDAAEFEQSASAKSSEREVQQGNVPEALSDPRKGDSPSQKEETPASIEPSVSSKAIESEAHLEPKNQTSGTTIVNERKIEKSAAQTRAVKTEDQIDDTNVTDTEALANTLDDKPQQRTKSSAKVSVPTKKTGKKATKSTTKPRASVIPNVLIAGSQKAGTTSIAHYLNETHGACFSDPRGGIAQGEGKETHFFDNWRVYNGSGLTYYRKVFEHCQGRSLVVDATPEFMKTAERIYETYLKHGSLDNLKIIFSLREPVSREISWYHHRLRDCKTQQYAMSACTDNGDPIAFRNVMQKELTWKLDQNQTHNLYGTYAQYLQLFFELFDRKQILILSYEEAKTNQAKFLSRIHKFLDLPGEPNALPRANSDNGKFENPPCDVQRGLAHRFAPYNDELYKLLETNPGPEMEQNPFPKFLNKCLNEDYPEDEVDPFVTLPTSSKHIAPNVIVGGAQQLLSVAVARYGLQFGPDGCFPVDMGDGSTEVTGSHFFDNSITFNKGIRHYQAMFEHCKSNDTMVVDATPDVLRFPKRVRELFDEQGTAEALKFIFVLRDPVRREISQYHQSTSDCKDTTESKETQWEPKSKYCLKNGEPVTFDAALKSTDVGKLKYGVTKNIRGLYAQYLKVWFEVWERKQILVLNYDEFETDPDTFSERIRRFLGVQGDQQLMDVTEDSVEITQPLCETAIEVSNLFRPFNDELYELLKANPGPKMEQRPFQKFNDSFDQCAGDKSTS